MQEPENWQDFPQEKFEQVCFHSLGLLEQNREYLEKHLRAADTDEYSLQALADMKTACARLDRSLNEMMALLACLRGTAQPALCTFDLGTLVRALNAQQEPVQRELGITLCVDAPEQDGPFAVFGDREWAEQICFHLISNALHACDRGGHVWLALQREPDKLLLTVADDGCGLPETAPQANRTHFLGGAQAGLLLCREYCRRLGWSLSLSSRDTGTKALLTIPADTPAVPHASIDLCEESEQERQRRAAKLDRLLAGEMAEMAGKNRRG